MTLTAQTENVKTNSGPMEILSREFATDLTAHGKPVELKRSTSILGQRAIVTWFVRLAGDCCWNGTFRTADDAARFYYLLD